MILHGRLLMLLTLLAPLASASCIGEAFLDAVELFPDGDSSSSGAGTPTSSGGLPTSTATSTGDPEIQTATGLPDGDTTGPDLTASSSSGADGADTGTGEAVNQPPQISEFEASAYFVDAAGPLTLTLAASDDHAVVKIRLYLDDEEIESNLTLADFPYVYDVLSAKYNGDERTFKVVVEDAEGLTAEAVTMPITISLPESGVERCFFEDPDKGSVVSVISAIEYTPEAIFAVGTRGLRLAVWKLDPDDCHIIPGWPKTINSWTDEDEFKGYVSIGAAVDEDEDGNIVVGGNFLVDDKPQAYAALLTDDGARLWEKAGTPGDELAGVAAGIGLHHNRVFVVGSVYTSDNPVRTDAAIWIFHYDGESVYIAPPTVLKAPLSLDEQPDDENNRSEWVRAVVVQPSTGYAVAVGEREFKPNDINKVYRRTFIVRVQPTGGVVGTPWTSPADASFIHDAMRSIAVCGAGFMGGGWTRDLPVDAQPVPMMFWIDAAGTGVKHRADLQMASTQIHGIACDREDKIVSAGTRTSGSSDVQVFAVIDPDSPRTPYESGVPGDDGAGAMACDWRGFCGWGGYRTANMKAYAVVRVHNP